jgi:peptidoglycan/xylan/chitin deacetylase (PgdA/CDA1 family)
VFTVDDGYADFARVIVPVFAEFDCPVTVFLVTGAVDGTCWFWWDRVEFAVESTKCKGIGLDLPGRTVNWPCETPRERAATVALITESLKVMPNEQKELSLTMLAERLEVEIPAKPTPRYSAMSWRDVRRCATMGVTFGPHTVTHPILPTVTDTDAKWEVLESWRRLRAECDAVVPVFAYPSGVFSVREVSILAGSDLTAAFTTKPRYASRAALHAPDPRTRFTVPRFAYAGDRAAFVQVVVGAERLKLIARSWHDGPSAASV